MPWKAVKQGSSYSVVNIETGKVRGTGMTEPEAKRMVKALYANVKEPGKKKRGSLTVPYDYKPGEP